MKEITYKYWLAKNGKKDTVENFTEYYKAYASESFFKAPAWLQAATIEQAYKTRFCKTLY